MIFLSELIEDVRWMRKISSFRHPSPAVDIQRRRKTSSFRFQMSEGDAASVSSLWTSPSVCTVCFVNMPQDGMCNISRAQICQPTTMKWSRTVRKNASSGHPLKIQIVSPACGASEGS